MKAIAERGWTDEPGLREAIEVHFSRKTGPFAYLFPDDGVNYASISGMGSFQVGRLLESNPSPPTQLAIVRAAKYISVLFFGDINTRSGQIEVLSKLSFDPGDPSSHAGTKEELFQYLVKGSKDNAVTEAIVKHQRDQTGPFSMRLWATCVQRHAQAQYLTDSNATGSSEAEALTALSQAPWIRLESLWRVKGFRLQSEALSKLSRAPDETRSVEELQQDIIAQLEHGKAQIRPDEWESLKGQVQQMANARVGVFEGLQF